MIPLAIAETWRALAAHARGCGPCEGPVATLRRVPDDPRQVDGRMHAALCEVGRELFTPWWEAKGAWLESTLAARRQQFVTEEQLADDLTTFARRAAAIMSMPAPAMAAWLEMPERARHDQLRALERAVRRESTVSPEPAARGERAVPAEPRCAGCGKSLRNRQGPYCSRACRRSQQPELINTEE